MERRGPAVCNSSGNMGGKGGMTTTPVSLQDLRRKVYAKAKAEPHWRFWGCRARNRRGFGWERWSTQWLHDTLGLFNGYRVRLALRKVVSVG